MKGKFLKKKNAMRERERAQHARENEKKKKQKNFGFLGKKKHGFF